MSLASKKERNALTNSTVPVRVEPPKSIIATSIGGVSAGMVASVVTCPLDVVKTRVQAQAGADHVHVRYRGTWSSLRTIFADEGIRGFYRGLWPTMVGLTFNWSVYFACYSRFQRDFASIHPSLRHGTALNHMTSAIVAGAVTATVTSPFWVVKTRYQTHSAPNAMHGEKTGVNYRGVFSTIYSIAQREGASALYKGLGVSMFGLIHVAIQFPLYEYLKVRLADDEGDLSVSRLIVATAASKTIAGSVSYPHEIVRSRQQHSTTRLRAIDTARHIWQHDGLAGFYHGMGTNLLRVVPSCVITFVTYEFVVHALTDAINGRSASDL